MAVLAVLCFHFGVSWFGGGLLGVDVFFVLSGFLITTLLLGEWEATGTLRFLRFYGRRARRLLPGLVLLLGLVAIYAAWFAEPDTLATIRGDALSTLGYVANWRFVLSDQGYFVHFGPPSPLLHTWSLAVEEQFYLVWPAVTWFVLRRWGRRALGLVAVVAALASALVTLLLLDGGVSVTRLYYGTDTRTQEIMVGALLAIAAPAVVRWRHRDTATATAGRWRGRLVGGLGILGAAFLVWALHAVSGQGNFLYRGGFLLVAVAAAGVIAAVVHQPAGVLGRGLSVAPLRYVGRISYGLYLYHYPLFLLLDPERTGLTGAALLAVRFAATFAVAVASYHLVELPIRRRRFVGWWRAGVPLALAGVVTVVVLATTLPATGSGGAAQPTVATRFAVPATPPPGLTGAGRVRVLLLGDSLALTLGSGLGKDASAFGVDLDNGAQVGCDLDPDSTVRFQGITTKTAQGCADWPATWAAEVRRTDPDVVALELGRWEVTDRLIDGHWSTVGQPAWDHLYASELSRAIRVLSAHGAKVVVFTLPYIAQTTDAPDGTPWDINQPWRTDAYNALVRSTVARFPGTASVVDLNALLDPQGHYVSDLDGVRVRNVDDEHVSVAGGMLLRPEILPQLVALGRAHAADRTRAAATTPR